MRTLTSAPRSEGDSDVMPTGAVGADSDGTSLPLPMTSLSDAGSLLDEMPSCLPPAESMTDKGGDGSGGHEVLSTVNVRRREVSAPANDAPTDAANTTPTYSSETGLPSDGMTSSSQAGSPDGMTDGMTSSSEAGLPSDGMPAASPPAALTVVLPASDACVSQKARGYVLQVGAHCHVRESTSLLVSKRRRRRRELEHELVTGGRHQLEFELHVDRVPAARGGMHAKESR